MLKGSARAIGLHPSLPLTGPISVEEDRLAKPPCEEVKEPSTSTGERFLCDVSRPPRSEMKIDLKIKEGHKPFAKHLKKGSPALSSVHSPMRAVKGRETAQTLFSSITRRLHNEKV